MSETSSPFSRKAEKIASRIGINPEDIRSRVCSIPSILSDTSKSYCQRDIMKLVCAVMVYLDKEITFILGTYNAPIFPPAMNDAWGNVNCGPIPDDMLVIASLDHTQTSTAEKLQLNNIGINFGAVSQSDHGTIMYPSLGAISIKFDPSPFSKVYYNRELSNLLDLSRRIETSIEEDPVMNVGSGIYADRDLAYSYISSKTGKPTMTLRNPGNRLISSMETLRDTVYHLGPGLAKRVRFAARTANGRVCHDMLRLATILELIGVLSRGLIISPHALEQCTLHLNNFSDSYIGAIMENGAMVLAHDLEKVLIPLSSVDTYENVADSIDYELHQSPTLEVGVSRSGGANRCGGFHQVGFSDVCDEWNFANTPKKLIPRDEVFIGLTGTARSIDKIQLVEVPMNTKCVPKVLSDLRKIGIYAKVGK